MKMRSLLFTAAFVAGLVPATCALAQDEAGNEMFLQSLQQSDPASAEYLTLANHSLTLRCGRAPTIAYLRKIDQAHVPTIVPDGHASDLAQIAALSCEEQPHAN